MKTMLKEICRVIKRSDGTTKLYGQTTEGELLTVVFDKNSKGDQQIVEIAKSAIIINLFPLK